MGKGLHLCRIHLSIQVDALRLLCEDHWYIKMLRYNTGDTDTRSLYSQDFIDVFFPKFLFKRFSHLVK